MDDASAEDRYLEIKGNRLRYRDEGGGPPVVLLHGWTLDLDMWEAQVAGLKDVFRIVRLDRRGFGLSSGHPGLAGDTEDLSALCRHLGLWRIALVGMSQGARAALHIARAIPALVSCLVLDGPPPDYEASESADDAMPFAFYRHLVRTTGIAAVRREWAQHPLAQLRTDDARAHELLARMIGRYPGSDLEESTSDAPLIAPSRALASIRVPTLVINGEFDLETRRSAAETLVRALPAAEHAIVPDAAHLPNLDNPHAYNATLRDFLLRHAIAFP
jgi:pimeloyl-ACP methyl ester carboxylesterase